MSGTRVATKTTELADGRTVEDEWKYECDDGHLLLHSQDGVFECYSYIRMVLPSDLPSCVKRECDFLKRCFYVYNQLEV